MSETPPVADDGLSGESTDNVPEDRIQPYDWTLEVLVDMISKAGGRFTVTLLVGGVQVSGMAIGADQWAQEWAEQFAQGGIPADSASAIGDEIRGILADAERQVEERREADMPWHRREFIHLRDAAIVNSPNSTGDLPLWRIRLSAVDGWSMGAWARG